jgi:hypothetical protein
MMIAQGIFHSGVLFYGSAFTLDHTTLSDGTDNDLWSQSTLMFTALVILVNIKIALWTSTWVTHSHWAFWCSMAIWFIYHLAYSALYVVNPDMYWVFYRLAQMPNFWLGSAMLVVVCLVPDLTWAFVRRTLFFTRADIIAEREKGFLYGPDLAAHAAMDTVAAAAEKAAEAAPGVKSAPGASATQPQAAAAAGAIEMAPLSGGEAGAAAPGAVSGGPDERDDAAVTAANWDALARRGPKDLGFVPFVEDETGEAFVMGQEEFLQRYMAVRDPNAILAIDQRRQARSGRAAEADDDLSDEDEKRE